MAEFLRHYQLDIMLAWGSICGMLAVFTLVTTSLPSPRKRALFLMEFSAMILLYADRLAYIYRGNVSEVGYYMVRITNFLVFFMSLVLPFTFSLYLKDLLIRDCGIKKLPKRMVFVKVLFLVGGFLVIFSQFTGFYYTFDETNHYVRAPGFLICYAMPCLMLLTLLTVMVQYFKRLSPIVRNSLLLFAIIPIIASTIQIFTYGLSLTNISVVGMAILLYMFALIDMNATVERLHKMEMEELNRESKSMKRLFEQTTTAFASAIDERDEFAKGHSLRVAKYARRIAKYSGKDEDSCVEIYFAALLHDVGMIGIPDEIIKKGEELTEEEREKLREKPLIGEKILANITEYPYLEEGARYSCERFDGTGYPEGLKGSEIPEIARIVAIADAYDSMTTSKRYRDALPFPVVREAFITEAGRMFDPAFTKIMVGMLDEERKSGQLKEEPIEKELVCEDYRSQISAGIPVGQYRVRIRFSYEAINEGHGTYHAPSLILFDAYDGRVHKEVKAISAYQYTEFGEFWFDGHCITTKAKNIGISVTEADINADVRVFSVTAARFEDHLKLVLESAAGKVEAVVAFTDNSKRSFLGLTGENCRIYDIEVEQTKEQIEPDEIVRIAEPVSYINRIESDVPNVQIDGMRSASTKGIVVKNGMRLRFHTMTLPTGKWIWDCPYVVLFSSDNQEVYGPNYREYALVKLNGENEETQEYAKNQFTMKKTGSFAGWNNWKEQHLQGIECEITLYKKGNRITIVADTLGVSVQNQTTLKQETNEICVALTGQQCALTDIRVL